MVTLGFRVRLTIAATVLISLHSATGGCTKEGSDTLADVRRAAILEIQDQTKFKRRELSDQECESLDEAYVNC